MQVFVYLSQNGDHTSDYEFADDVEALDDDEVPIMAPIAINKIKKILPKLPSERKENLGKCTCEERADNSLKSAKSFLDERERDGSLHLSKKDADKLLKHLNRVVSSFLYQSPDFHLQFFFSKN